MPTPSDLLRFGYWPYRQLSGEIPAAIVSPEEYADSAVLNIACTQTGLPANQQRRLVGDWVRRLPTVPATTIVFSSKVSQELFDAACSAPCLQALSVKWTSCTSLAELVLARSLRALFLGSSPKVTDLSPLASLVELHHLFIENVGAPVDLSAVGSLVELREFGLSAARGQRLPVLSLEPLGHLAALEMLWLVSLQIEHGDLHPLHRLRNLKSLRTTIPTTSPSFKALCTAVPSLEFFHAVG
jgi:hypothetical protein